MGSESIGRNVSRHRKPFFPSNPKAALPDMESLDPSRHRSDRQSLKKRLRGCPAPAERNILVI
jgi:hypothetical protein